MVLIALQRLVLPLSMCPSTPIFMLSSLAGSTSLLSCVLDYLIVSTIIFNFIAPQVLSPDYNKDVCLLQFSN